MHFRLRPTYIIEHVTDINLDDLKGEGIKGLLFDLDNTLMPPNFCELTEDIEKWLIEVKKDFKIAIVSNNPKLDYIEEARKILDCPVYGKAKKPQRTVALKALKELDILPSQAVIVGDRPLTDIFVGQRLGMITVLVDPLIKHQEHAVIKFLRRLERFFIHPASKKFSVNNKE